MRGKVSTIDTTPFTVGITPAYAGKRFRFERSQCRFWDHPRLCGEKIMSVMKLRNTSGSPPPMRGKVPSFLPVSAADGITPAYAGKRSRVDLCTTSSQDHPRLCGEKTEILFAHGCHLGSPPPMRGKAYRQKIRHHVLRITPAYAGKSIRRTTMRVLLRDHPRLCGEKRSSHSFKKLSMGSPPPMRGKVTRFTTQSHNARITPAYAGKSVSFCTTRYGLQDHPRLCGEKGIWNKFADTAAGSPPPMRGKGSVMRVHSFNQRITPAYAGKS